MSTNYNDFIYAYCLGCLDREDLYSFIDQLNSAGDINMQELGEFQNLVALLPGILKMELPDLQVKDKVARKLYRIKNEVKQVRRQNRLKTVEIISIADEVPKVEPVNTFDQIRPDPIEESPIQVEEIPEPVKDKTEPIEDIPAPVDDPDNVIDEAKIVTLKPRRTTEYQRPSHVTQIKGRESGNLFTPYIPKKEDDLKVPDEHPEYIEDQIHEEKYPEEEETINYEEYQESSEPEPIVENIPPPRYNPPAVEDFSYKGPVPKIQEPGKKNYALMIVSFLTFFVIVILLLVLYMKLTSDVSVLKKDIENQSKKITSLSMQLSSNKEIQDMLNSPNIKIVNLTGTNLNKSGYGKLIIRTERGTGFIQLAQMPALAQDKVYQLWLTISGATVPLGTFKPTESLGYYSFRIRLTESNEAAFKVTEEPLEGSKYPSNRIYLVGNL